PLRELATNPGGGAHHGHSRTHPLPHRPHHRIRHTHPYHMAAHRRHRIPQTQPRPLHRPMVGNRPVHQRTRPRPARSRNRNARTRSGKTTHSNRNRRTRHHAPRTHPRPHLPSS